MIYTDKILFILILLSTQSFKSQIDSTSSNNKLKSKTSFGGVPILSFDADIGLRYGSVVNYYKYNDSTSDNYSENLFFRVYNTTKRSFQVQSVYETDNLFKNSKTYIEATYLKDKSYDFYGFNGNQSRYNPSFEDSKYLDFLQKDFYSINRELIRFRFDYQRYIMSPRYRILIGLTLSKMKIDQNIEENNLYSKYTMMNLISEKEKNGGIANYLSFGLVYDNRNNQCYCSNGTWFESFVILSPKIVSSTSFSKLIVSYRSYNEFFKKRFVFMFRSSLQYKTSGTIPSYLKSTYFETKLNQDGLGGSFNLRGYNRNRIVADGFGLINLELRKKVIKTQINKTKINFDLSVFSDNAIIIQYFLFEKANIPNEYLSKLFDFNPKKYYSTVGFGVYIVLNRNSVISLNYGIPISKETKGGALYIGSSFLF